VSEGVNKGVTVTVRLPLPVKENDSEHDNGRD
jgi:hypothetical protein